MDVICGNAFDLGIGGAVTDQYGTTYPLAQGGYVVSLDNAYPVTGTQQCGKSQVLLDSSAYNTLLSGASPAPEAPSCTFALSPADGASLAWQVGACWAVAFAARLVINALRVGSSNDSES